ncbi:MAG: ferrochelatase [Candidatus Sericytochromatia bacterium]|nr:ferrochelatase [Candidatus Sericytochromatia bacterium]
MRQVLLILNFGGPQRAGEVEPFLFELFRDPDVIPIPGPPIVREAFADLISGLRWTKTARQYGQIGGGSPLVPTTYEQGAALQRALAERGLDFEVHYAMRYTRPDTRTALMAIREGGPARIVTLAMYPHYSFATIGSSYGELARQLKALGMQDWPVTYVPAFPVDPDYVAAVAETIREAVADRTADEPLPHLLFSAHGLPVSFVQKGDPYPRHIQATVQAVVAELNWQGPHSLAWQSKVGPAAWLTPGTETELRRLGAAGCSSVLVVPVSFVGDHIETLFELDIEYREVAEEAGIHRWRRAPALDVRPRFIQALANQVQRALAPEPACLPGCCRLPRPVGMKGLRVIPGGCVPHCPLPAYTLN